MRHDERKARTLRALRWGVCGAEGQDNVQGVQGRPIRVREVRDQVCFKKGFALKVASAPKVGGKIRV